MEIPENEYALKTNEPKIESNDNDTDEIEIFAKIDCCIVFLFVVLSILFLPFPVVFYFLLIL